MSEVRVVIYTTPTCGYCHRAKRLLAERTIGYREIDVSRDPATRAKIAAETGHTTVPMIFIDGQFIGGSDDLYELDRRGQLAALSGATAR